MSLRLAGDIRCTCANPSLSVYRLWSRLLLHFWALEIERRVTADVTNLDPIEYLQSAYEETVRATSAPTEWYGTTTSATALLHWTQEPHGAQTPLLYVTNLGDCKVIVIRPSEEKIMFRTEEQWHWFDCPKQLGTNSIDTPQKDAVLSKVSIREDDIILAVSDGVMDNLWEHEVLKIILDSLQKWDQGDVKDALRPPPDLSKDRMVYAAKELLSAALTIAQDPFAESPFMEKAVDEGLAIEGGMSTFTFECLAMVNQVQAKWMTFLSLLQPARNEQAENGPCNGTHDTVHEQPRHLGDRDCLQQGEPRAPANPSRAFC